MAGLCNAGSTCSHPTGMLRGMIHDLMLELQDLTLEVRSDMSYTRVWDLSLLEYLRK
jgi:hypothetical protein